LWTSGTMRSLGLPSGQCAVNSVGLGLNNSGHAVGYTWYPQGFCPTRVLFYSNGTSQFINNAMTGSATAIDDSGNIVGISGHAFLYAASVLTDLGSLGGPSGASAINNVGQIVGYSYPSGAIGAPYHPILWSGGQMTDLGTLGGLNAQALGINHTGHIIGVSQTTGGFAQHAFSWFAGTLTDLGTLGGLNSQADGINAGGQIVGWLTHRMAPSTRHFGILGHPPQI
jgi:probable HAF family extracellular repeat protein